VEVIQGLFGSRAALMVMMIAFMGVAWVANKWALSGASQGVQYAGLGLYVVAEAIIFLPLMYIAANYFEDVIPKAGIMTLAMFAGLTFAVFFTRQDFSFLAPILTIGGFLALGLIATSWIFPSFGLGNWFAFGMVALASAFILYDTSNVLHRYRTDQHVAASLALFASVALLFWYILQIFMSSRRN
jgi:FtsH-binding integral membrane protein